MSEIYQDIPTYDNGNWTTTSFDSREDFSYFILSIFKEPGKYNFNSLTSEIFISESNKFRKDGVIQELGRNLREDAPSSFSS